MTLILKGQKASDFGGIVPDAFGTFKISATLPLKKYIYIYINPLPVSSRGVLLKFIYCLFAVLSKDCS